MKFENPQTNCSSVGGIWTSNGIAQCTPCSHNPDTRRLEPLLCPSVGRNLYLGFFTWTWVEGNVPSGVTGSLNWASENHPRFYFRIWRSSNSPTPPLLLEAALSSLDYSVHWILKLIWTNFLCHCLCCNTLSPVPQVKSITITILAVYGNSGARHTFISGGRSEKGENTTGYNEPCCLLS